MNIEFENGTFTVAAAVIAEPLGLDPSAVQAQMRNGRITSLCERGVDEDAGRYRLTFFHGRRRLRVVVDESGTIVGRTVDRFSSRALRLLNQR
ncbi:MAG TPA: DUF6522 family protein [Steroidobacteraceae bacterium]|nr:DUF6522 family protein [Steroidobacteraceae bacterium]